MISALLLGTALFLGPSASKLTPLAEVVDVDPALAELGASGELEFLARASATRLVAVNPTPHPLYLCFAHRVRGAHAALLLAPRTQLEARFPAGTLADMRLEVASPGPHGGLASTGSLALDELLVEGVRGLWVDRDPHGLDHANALSAWIVDGAGRTPIAPESTMIKAPALPAARTAHVPGVTPREHQRRDEAPKLNRKPLPPL